MVGLAIQIAVDADSSTPQARVAGAARCRNPVRRTRAHVACRWSAAEVMGTAQGLVDGLRQRHHCRRHVLHQLATLGEHVAPTWLDTALRDIAVVARNETDQQLMRLAEECGLVP